MRKLVPLVALVVLAGFSSGCGTIAKRALKEFVGASAKAKPVPPCEADTFAHYGSVEIKPPRTNLGKLVDGKYSRALPGELRKALLTVDEKDENKEPLFGNGSPTLEIEPEITYYSERGGLGEILGSDSYAVVLFWLSDGGKPIGRVLTVTKSGATRDNEQDLAKETAKGLAKFFEKGRKPDKDDNAKDADKKRKRKKNDD